MFTYKLVNKPAVFVMETIILMMNVIKTLVIHMVCECSPHTYTKALTDLTLPSRAAQRSLCLLLFTGIDRANKVCERCNVYRAFVFRVRSIFCNPSQGFSLLCSGALSMEAQLINLSSDITIV